MSPVPSRPDYRWKKYCALFLISQNLSLFGSSLVSFAIVWHITLETASGWWMTLATLAFNIPGVVISLWGGVWADRYPRKTLIMLADAFVALATLAVALAFWAGWPSLELLLLASAFRSLGGGVQIPAVNALYPQLVPPEHLARVQGLNQSCAALLMLLSPAAGGLALALTGLEAALMIDVATALSAVIILAFINVPPSAPSAALSTRREMVRGLRYAFGHRQLRRLLICLALFYFLITPAGVLTPLMIARSFGPEVWRLTANELVWAGMSILGGLWVARHGDFQDKTRTLAICLAAFGLCFGLLGLAGSFTVYLILMGLAGFFMPVLTTAQTVFIQQTAEPGMLGRVFAASHMLTGVALPAGILIFGPLADLTRVENLLLVTGLMILPLAAWYGHSEAAKPKP